MKILGILLGAAGLGGFLYYHRRRSGRWTADALVDSAAQLIGRTRARAREVKERAEQHAIHEAATAMAKATAPEPHT